MKKVLSLYKPIGKTPLEVIEQLKIEYPEYKNARLGYAGRLDPMAEGILIILVDDENLKRKEYELLPKTYKFEALLGIETDTYDVLGIIKNVATKKYDAQKLQQHLENLIPTFIGKQIQPYPPYSSPRVKGKPLFYWAREGKLNEIEIPVKEIEIYSLKLNQVDTISKEQLLTLVHERIALVKGNFRQIETLNRWQEMINNNEDVKDFHVISCTISCSSGTYVRSLARKIGSELGMGGIALRIVRTKVGDYTIEDSIKL